MYLDYLYVVQLNDQYSRTRAAKAARLRDGRPTDRTVHFYIAKDAVPPTRRPAPTMVPKTHTGFTAFFCDVAFVAPPRGGSQRREAKQLK